jgi:hypothetical protein
MLNYFVILHFFLLFILLFIIGYEIKKNSFVKYADAYYIFVIFSFPQGRRSPYPRSRNKSLSPPPHLDIAGNYRPARNTGLAWKVFWHHSCYEERSMSGWKRRAANQTPPPTRRIEINKENSIVQ